MNRLTPIDVLTVVVNYKTADLVIDCLASLEPERAQVPGLRVSVVDNASEDDSIARLTEAIACRGWGDWVELLPRTVNLGFAGGNNAAIRPALESSAPPRYFWLLNPDTIVRPGGLSELVGFLESSPRAGIAGSRLEDPDGTRQTSAFRFHTVLSEFENGVRLGFVSRLLRGRIVAPPPPESDEPIPTDWVSGASLIVRREVFETVGLLDEGFFMYFEETDFCRRARRGGWPCWHVPRSRVVHLIGRSSGFMDRRSGPKRRPSYWFEARRRYFLAHHGRVGTLLADLAWAAGYASYQARRPWKRNAGPPTPALLRDFLRHNLLPRPSGSSGRAAQSSSH